MAGCIGSGLSLIFCTIGQDASEKSNTAMTRRTLERMVAAGEGLYLEFKHRLPESERVAREITALANTQGGHLLVGVTDHGELTGIKDPEEEIHLLHRALKKYCIPNITFEIEHVRISRARTVIVVRVPASRQLRPHYVQSLSSQARSVFVRYQDMCIIASREACKLMRSRPESETTLIQLGEKERLLLKQLEREGCVTVYTFANYAKIHPGRASRILVRLTRANILMHHIDLNEDYFTPGTALSESA